MRMRSAFGRGAAFAALLTTGCDDSSRPPAADGLAVAEAADGGVVAESSSAGDAARTAPRTKLKIDLADGTTLTGTALLEVQQRTQPLNVTLKVTAGTSDGWRVALQLLLPTLPVAPRAFTLTNAFEDSSGKDSASATLDGEEYGAIRGEVRLAEASASRIHGSFRADVDSFVDPSDTRLLELRDPLIFSSRIWNFA
jgi:hypothetical protein